MNRVNRRLIIALAVSAALNVFFAGFVAARVVFAGRRGPERGDLVFDPRGRVFSGEAAGAAEPMKRIFGKHAEQLAPRRKALRKARQAVARSLQAEPFRPEALRAALADLRRITADSQEALHAALVETAVSLPPEQRRALSHSRFLQLSPARRPR